MNLTDPQERSAACAEYALDIMDGIQRGEFETAMSADPTLAVEVGLWRDRFHSLSTKVAPIEPSGDLWPRIAAALPQTRPRTARQRGRPLAVPFWQRLGVWRAISGLAVACSVMLAAMLWLREPPTQVYLAVLQSPQKQAGWMVQARTGGTVRLVPLGPVQTVPDNKSLELWTKPSDMPAPVSLGLIKPGQTIEIELSKLPSLGVSQLFAISLEPPSGSPTGAPTGPILFAGNTEPI